MFFDDFFSILTVFCSFYILRAILAQKENSFICEKKNVILWLPWGPWGHVHIDLDKNSVASGCVSFNERLLTSSENLKFPEPKSSSSNSCNLENIVSIWIFELVKIGLKMKKSGEIRYHFNIFANKMIYFVRYELDKTTKVCLRLIL